MSFHVICQISNYDESKTTIICLINNSFLYIDLRKKFKEFYIRGDLQPPLQDYLKITLVAEGFNNPLPGPVVYRLLTSEFEWPIQLYNAWRGTIKHPRNVYYDDIEEKWVMYPYKPV